jgi:hypothetical protein
VYKWKNSDSDRKSSQSLDQLNQHVMFMAFPLFISTLNNTEFKLLPNLNIIAFFPPLSGLHIPWVGPEAALSGLGFGLEGGECWAEGKRIVSLTLTFFCQPKVRLSAVYNLVNRF